MRKIDSRSNLIKSLKKALRLKPILLANGQKITDFDIKWTDGQWFIDFKPVSNEQAQISVDDNEALKRS